MKILICNERFIFRFGVDRVLLILASIWKKQGHEIIMMGNRLDEAAVDRCSDRFVPIPMAPVGCESNAFTLSYLKQHWSDWFNENNSPDVAFIAGWPFYECIGYLRQKCGYAFFHDYGAVPTEGMDKGLKGIQIYLRKLRKENLRFADAIIPISEFLKYTQSIPDTDGVIPVSSVLLGADHLEMNLWKKEVVNIDKTSVLIDIKKYQKKGYHIVFQPGRWESGNYKNSPASFELAKYLKEKNCKAKIVVLAKVEDMSIPSEIEDMYICPGPVDDASMQEIIRISDVGFLPTKWEGFDLPLAEMQYLNKPMFVLDIGAHPEVVAHPYFLCSDMRELARKLFGCLSGEMEISSDEYKKSINNFKNNFTWEKTAINVLKVMQDIMADKTIVFIDVTDACHDTANSGVMRVTRKLSSKIQKKYQTVFILWDSSIEQYVFPYLEEAKRLCSYGGPNIEMIPLFSAEGQPRRSLEMMWNTFRKTRKVLLFTETVYHKKLRLVIPMMQRLGVCIGAIFYDAIPVMRPELVNSNVSKNHIQYMKLLSNVDYVFPIAEHNRKHLLDFWRNNGLNGKNVLTVNLAEEMDGVPRNTNTKEMSLNRKKRILFVSTLEPRKNHLRLLEAFEKLMEEEPELVDNVKLTLIGNRYAGNEEIPERVEKYCKNNKNIEWMGVVDDETLHDLYEECYFTVYPSEIEGFGMPITESLWYGKPCLCSNKGSIGELAVAGGCAQTDVLSVEAIKKNLARLLKDDSYHKQLCSEATKRSFVTWEDYADAIGSAFSRGIEEEKSLSNGNIYDPYMYTRVKEELEGNKEDRIILCSNFYPPQIMGGAEVIAHEQAKALASAGNAVFVFSIDSTGRRENGNCFMDEIQGIPVLRISVASNARDFAGINFFSKNVNDAFEEYCRLIKPSVVHCHNVSGMSLEIFDIAKRFGAKVCLTLHDHWGFCMHNTMLDDYGEACEDLDACYGCRRVFGDGESSVPLKFRRDYMRHAFEKVDAFISPSKYLAKTYVQAGFPNRRMHVLWNGCGTKRFSNISHEPSDKIRITYVGFFGEHKGVDILLKAVAASKVKNLEINLVGEGSEKENYRKLAASLGILSMLNFWGKVPNECIDRVYAQTDIYCLPSRWKENQPVTITEAMASGVPVIASDIGGNSELVVNGITGLLFRSGDYEDLAEKISLLCTDSEMRQRLGEGGREVMQKNDFSVQAEKLKKIYALPAVEVTPPYNLIAFKGNHIPQELDSVQGMDFTLLDWVEESIDFDEIKACVLLSGAVLSFEEKKILQNTGKKILISFDDYKHMEEFSDVAVSYHGTTDMLEKIKEILGL